MSKHLGNVLEPIPLMDEHGADAVRWFMLAGGSPWQARRVGHGAIEEVVRKTLLTYWNTASFQVLYARDGWVRAGDGGRARRRASGPRSTGGRCPQAHRLVARGRRRARRVRHPARGPAALGRSSTTCRTGTSAGRAAGSGTATRPRSRRCTSACTW